MAHQVVTEAAGEETNLIVAYNPIDERGVGEVSTSNVHGDVTMPVLDGLMNLQSEMIHAVTFHTALIDKGEEDLLCGPYKGLPRRELTDRDFSVAPPVVASRPTHPGRGALLTAQFL